MMCTGDGGVPLFFRVADGKEADQATFTKLIRESKTQLDFDALFVADSALYGADELPSLNHLRWPCRVPQTIKEDKTLLEEIPEEAFAQSALEGYRLAETRSEYGGVEQRWVVVESAQRQKAQNKQLEKKLKELDERLGRQLEQLRRQRFNCEADARKALDACALRGFWPLPPAHGR